MVDGQKDIQHRKCDGNKKKDNGLDRKTLGSESQNRENSKQPKSNSYAHFHLFENQTHKKCANTDQAKKWMQSEPSIFVSKIINCDDRNAQNGKTLDDLLCFQVKNFFKDKIFIDKFEKRTVHHDKSNSLPINLNVVFFLQKS